jgi:hypothetical protein
MRRRLVAISSIAAALSAVWACTFPLVTFGDADNDELDAAVSSDVEPPEEESGPILIDGSAVDALVVVDAGGKVDAAGCTACSCDGDEYNKPDAGCPAVAGEYDCDDNDTRTHPYQGYLFDKAEPPRNGDWDCNGKVEKLWTNESASCAGLTLGVNCQNIFGFTEPVACGEKGRWIRCKKRPGILTLDCVVDEERLETQLCK